MSVDGEYLAHQIANLLGSALIKHQDGGPSPAQRTAQKPGRAQLQDVAQSWRQVRAVGLMETIFERRRKRADGPRGEGRDQQRRSLDVEYGVLARVTVRQHRSRFRGGEDEI